jgi:hypothetical protein
VEIVILLLFVSLLFVLLAVGLFAWTVRQKSHEHADRLALLPLQRPTTSGWSSPQIPTGDLRGHQELPPCNE